MSIRIIVAGPRGRMGSTAIEMIKNEPNFQLVACLDRKNNGKRLKDISDIHPLDVPIFDHPDECFKTVQADIFLDLTIPEVGYRHAKSALQHHIRTVIGTSGLTNDQINDLTKLARNHRVGCIIAPNFAIGAVLMMQFAKFAAQYFPNVEIIEKHHDQKVDAPSGTALKTVDMIRETREKMQQGHPDEYETVSGARGGNIDGIPIHSVRLPGLVAHQQVIFGGNGQTLTISHDSLNRHSFMDGMKLAIHHVMSLRELIYGLENILEPIEHNQNKKRAH